jgi:hypothetical protein
VRRTVRIRPRAALGWLAVLALIELCTRALVYGLAPTASARLTGELGGPSTVIVTLVALGLAVTLSAAIVWLASMGARERWALGAHAPGEPSPRLRVRPLLLRGGVLWLASMLVFTAIENYIHYRAGMGVHGLSCLLGPVHRDAIPVAAALSLLAAAAVSAAALLLSWMRRSIARVFGVRPRPLRLPPHGLGAVACAVGSYLLVPAAQPRGPPRPVV